MGPPYGKRDPYKLPHTTPIWVPLTIRGSYYWGSLESPLNFVRDFVVDSPYLTFFYGDHILGKVVSRPKPPNEKREHV